MLCEIPGMLQIRAGFNTLQTCEGGWEESDTSGRTPCRTKRIKGWIFARTSRHEAVWVAKKQSTPILTVFRKISFLTKHEFSWRVSLLLKDVLLHWCLHHSPPLQPPRKDCIHIRQTTAWWWFCDWAWKYYTSIYTWTALQAFSSPFQSSFPRYGSW